MKRGRGRPAKYDWKFLLTAGRRVFTQGTDFTCSPINMQSQVYDEAHRQGVKAWCSVKGKEVTFEFYEGAKPLHAIDRRCSRSST